MPAPYPLKIPNPSFERYAYYILSDLTKEQKNQLETPEVALVENEKELQRFITKEGHAKTEILLMKVGIESIRIFYDINTNCSTWNNDNPNDIDACIFSTQDQYQYPKKRSDLIEAMAEKKIYATSNRELISAVIQMAQNANTKLYQITQATKDVIKQYLTLKEKVKKSPNILTSNQEVLDDAAEAYAGFNKLILEQLNSYDYALQNLRLTQPEIRVISALYAKPCHAISLQELAQGTKLDGKQAYLKKVVDSLEEQDYVISDRTVQNRRHNKVPYYLLTAKGIKAMITYINYIFQKSF